MTNKIEETRRALFEAHLKISNSDEYARFGVKIFECDGDTYVLTSVNWGWQMWNAALDAVVIDLPKTNYYSDMQRSQGVDDCRDAINSTNLGLKIE